MRLHVFGFANISTRKENTWEPFTPLTFNLCKMFHDNGNYVIFYGAEGSNPPCSEAVNVVPSIFSKKDWKWRPAVRRKRPGATMPIARLGKPLSRTADVHFIDDTGQGMWH